MDSLVPVHCKLLNSLLVSAGDRKALLHLEAGPRDSKAARERLTLEGNRNNYANFSPMLDQQPAESETPAIVVTQEGWRDNETEIKFDAVKFSGPLWARKARGATRRGISERFRREGWPHRQGRHSAEVAGTGRR